jgi:hypothetical protein
LPNSLPPHSAIGRMASHRQCLPHRPRMMWPLALSYIRPAVVLAVPAPPTWISVPVCSLRSSASRYRGGLRPHLTSAARTGPAYARSGRRDRSCFDRTAGSCVRLKPRSDHASHFRRVVGRSDGRANGMCPRSGGWPMSGLPQRGDETLPLVAHKPIDPRDIPPRAWLIGKWAIQEYVSLQVEWGRAPLPSSSHSHAPLAGSFSPTRRLGKCLSGS